jgi:hypothetical protein
MRSAIDLQARTKAPQATNLAIVSLAPRTLFTHSTILYFSSYSTYYLFIFRSYGQQSLGPNTADRNLLFSRLSYVCIERAYQIITCDTTPPNVSSLLVLSWVHDKSVRHISTFVFPVLGFVTYRIKSNENL